MSEYDRENFFCTKKELTSSLLYDKVKNALLWKSMGTTVRKNKVKQGFQHFNMQCNPEKNKYEE